ncbi:MAG TPA: transglycosylase SLT domain-containing protein [Burkholderiales bacterium]|jgi:soluble lytic murein transglycosylase-like protein|nr:transglycosylase SLT domain-containing protein [Burkholderiales bacterium]HVJ23624.1 transglycosylase SLT domain-containing protein [Burkholderiales bacterium]
MTSVLLNARRFYQALKSLLALVGLAALAAYFALPQLPTMPLAAGLPSFAPVAPAAAAAAELPTALAEAALEREQEAVAEYIARRYRIADNAATHFVSIAYRAAEQHRLDALLVLAVMAIESRYNPVAESVMGAKGLMQVIPKYHQEKLFEHGGDEALLEPEVNIQVGAQILREYQRRFGDIETALQMYAGALDEPTSQYANKVFAEKARLDALRFKVRKTGQSV